MRLTFTAIFLSYWWRLNLLVYFLMTLGLDRGCTILLLQASVVVFKSIDHFCLEVGRQTIFIQVV